MCSFVYYYLLTLCSIVKNIVCTSDERALRSPQTFLRPQLRLGLKTRSRIDQTPLSTHGTKCTISTHSCSADYNLHLQRKL